jgi:hypothetical protein
MDSAANKQTVTRFNIEVIQQGRREAFEALMAPDFVNWSAPPQARGRRACGTPSRTCSARRCPG